MTQTKTRQPTRTSQAKRATPCRSWLAVGLLILGAGAASLALLGPLVGDVIRYHASDGAINQIIGGDVAGLFLMAPVSIVAAALIWRNHRAGPILALGPAVYALYMYSQLALGGDVIRYPGNTERFFPLYLTLFIVAGAIAIRAWGMINDNLLPATKRWVDRTLGSFFLVVAVFLTFGLHLPGLTAVWSGDSGPEYLADPGIFWLVKFMDLGMVVPVMVFAGVGILRGAAWARKIKYAAVGWAALLGSSVAGMAIVMQLTGDPAGTLANTIAFSTFAVISVAIAWILYRPLFARTLLADFVKARSQ